MKAPLRVLHLEDNPTDAELIRQTLVEGGISCDVAMVDTREGFLAALQRGGFDIILADYRLPAFDGPSALKIAREKCPEVPFIMVSGILGEELAVETVKSGATDYVLKNRLSRLAPTVRRAIREAEDRMVRQRMGEALAESEQKYRALFEGSLEAMCLTKEGKIVDVNPAWLKLHGFQNRNEALGMDVLSVIHPDDRHILEERRANFQEGLTRIYQVRDVRKDGSILDVELYSSAIVIGGTTGILTTIRDVTTRKRAEQKVKALQRQIEFILGATKTGLDIIDTNFNLRYIDPEWAKIYGDPTGRKCYEYFMGRSAPCPGCGIPKALETKSRIVTEEILAKEGNRPIQVITIPFQDEKGEWLLAEVNVDITERKRAEEKREQTLRWEQGIAALQQSLLAPAPLGDKLRSISDGIVRLFDADFCCIWLIRPGDLCERGCIHAEVKEGPHVCRHRDRCLHLLASSGRYTHIDDKVHRRVPFGCYKIGRGASDEDRKFLTNDVQTDPRVHDHEWARELGLVSFAGYQLRVPGGDKFGVLALFTKHLISDDEDAMLDGLSSTVARVVQHAAAEEEIRRLNEDLEQRVKDRTTELAAANKELEAFAYAVSHDLRAPLVRIDGFSKILLRKYAETLDVQGKDYLERVSASTQRMAELINDLLAFSRTMRHVMKPQSVDLSALAGAIASELRKTAPRRKVEFKIAPGLAANGDPHLLQVVLENLLGNAWKFTGKKEEARIEFGQTHGAGVGPPAPTEAGAGAAEPAANDKPVFFVRDNGAGFNMAYVHKLFGPFQRLHAAKDFEGTGVGLSTVQRIIHRHGGRIWAEGAVEQGATFYFAL